MKFLYIHFPKAGGTSLSWQLDEHFPGQILADYSHAPVGGGDIRHIRTEAWPDQSIKGVRGHLHPSRYVNWCDVLFTILREPVDNIISIYFFWLGFPATGPIHTKFLEERPSIEEFAKRYPLRNLMSEEYFGDFDMDLFDYVGFSDLRQEAFDGISSLIGVPLKHEVHLNKTDVAHEGVRQAIGIDKRLIASLRSTLQDDIRFYENMRAKWSK